MKLDIQETLVITLNALSQLVVRFSGTITTFLATILIAKVLGVEELGSFIKITSFVSIFYLVVDFGFNSIFLKNYFHKAEEFFGNLLFLRFVISLVTFFIACGIGFMLPFSSHSGYSMGEKIGILIFSFTIFTEGVIVSFSGLLQKHLLQRKLILPTLLSNVFLIIGIIVSIFLKNMFILLLIYPLCELLQIILLQFMVKKSISYSIKPSSFSSFSKKTLLSSSPLALMLLLNVVYFRADSFILALFKDNVAVGAYGFSYKIFEFLIAFPTFFSAGIFPVLIKNAQNNKVFEEKVISQTGILLLSSLVFLVLACFLAPYVVLLKPEFALAVLPIQILSASLPFFFLTSLFQWVLLLKERIKTLVLIYAFTMFLNIILNVIFIPRYSYIASSFITVFTEGLVCVCMVVVLVRLKIKS